MSGDDAFWWERAERIQAAYDAEMAGDPHGSECRCAECSFDLHDPEGIMR